jgi:hypothetical protein
VQDWEDITSDYNKFSKPFQVLTYAYMLHKANKINFPVEAGIISFKNLSSGFIKFNDKNSNSTLINDDTLKAFETQLKKLILEICNPKIDFVEKEIL